MTPQFIADEPLDLFEEIRYLSEAESQALQEEAAARARREAIAHVNEIQKLLAGRIPRGDSFKFLREVWNLNASFLSDSLVLQTEYLQKQAAPKGGE